MKINLHPFYLCSHTMNMYALQMKFKNVDTQKEVTHRMTLRCTFNQVISSQ